MEKCRRVIFIETDDIERYPPEISVLNALSENEKTELIVCSLCPSEYMKDFCKNKQIKLINANGIVLRKIEYPFTGLVKKLKDHSECRKRLWKAIESVYKEADILWINTFYTLKLLGDRLLDYKYVVHLYELIRETRYYYRLPFPRYDFGKFLRGAYRVIECEYNRACITQVWFGLKQRPAVIPNKLYLGKKTNDVFSVDKSIKDKMDGLEGKKIILYQGILGPERPIGVFAEAVSELGDDYVMLVMSDTKMGIKLHNLVEIGFINPPNHLYVTQRAYIGILNYQSSSNGYSGNDSLNSIYCAPNKVYEYSRFGLPMIGNDIPGLKYSVEYSGAGVCIKNMDKEEIKEAILKISNDYEAYRAHSIEFYNSVDIRQIIEKEVLSEV